MSISPGPRRVRCYVSCWLSILFCCSILVHRSVHEPETSQHIKQWLNPEYRWTVNTLTIKKGLVPNNINLGGIFLISNFRHVLNVVCFLLGEGKGKGRLWILQHCCLEAYCTLTRMSSFIHLQRRCTHQTTWETSASEGRNYTWNLASNL